MDRLVLAALGVALILFGVAWSLARSVGGRTVLAAIAGYWLGNRERTRRDR